MTLAMISAPVSESQTCFCIPIFNDWESASLLLTQISDVATDQQWTVSVLFVDDGSTEPEDALRRVPLDVFDRVEILRLRRNLGHQRAIAIGLAFIAAERPCEAVVVMDGDGEDAPQDVVHLWQAFLGREHQRVIFAQRARRTEGLGFRCCYFFYKALHLVLTGRRVEVGNFSIVPKALLDRLIGVSELWNHYAAAVFKARLPVSQIPIARAKRFRGSSKMNFVSLVTHGLSAISVFGEEVGVRLLIATGALMALSVAGLATVACIRLFTQLAIPGWASSSAGFLGIALLNALMLSGLFSFALLQARNAMSFLPLRDYRNYVLQVVRLDRQS